MGSGVPAQGTDRDLQFQQKQSSLRDSAFPCGRSWVRARKGLVVLRAAAYKDSAFPTYLADTQFYIQLSMLSYL